jgi:hypothetical protein
MKITLDQSWWILYILSTCSFDFSYCFHSSRKNLNINLLTSFTSLSSSRISLRTSVDNLQNCGRKMLIRVLRHYNGVQYKILFWQNRKFTYQWKCECYTYNQYVLTLAKHLVLQGTFSRLDYLYEKSVKELANHRVQQRLQNRLCIIHINNNH